jgi:hypothetical protein
MRYGGFFAPNPENKITLLEINERGKQIEKDLACGKRVIADLSKDELWILDMWRKKSL